MAHTQAYYNDPSLGARIEIIRAARFVKVDDVALEYPQTEKLVKLTQQLMIGYSDHKNRIVVYITSQDRSGLNVVGIAGCIGCACDKAIGGKSSRILERHDWQPKKPGFWARHVTIMGRIYIGTLAVAQVSNDNSPQLSNVVMSSS